MSIPIYSDVELHGAASISDDVHFSGDVHFNNDNQTIVIQDTDKTVFKIDKNEYNTHITTPCLVMEDGTTFDVPQSVSLTGTSVEMPFTVHTVADGDIQVRFKIECTSESYIVDENYTRYRYHFTVTGATRTSGSSVTLTNVQLNIYDSNYNISTYITLSGVVPYRGTALNWIVLATKTVEDVRTRPSSVYIAPHRAEYDWTISGSGQTILDISGNNIYIRAGAIQIKNDSITAPVFYGRIEDSSDKNLKTNITSYSPKLSILTLPLYEYDYIDSNQHAIGCMAQDLQHICPEIVHQNEQGLLTIQESKIVYLLLDEMKKMRQELDELKQK